jgi:hypothetical protein
VRPTAGMHQIPAPDFAIAGITVGLEDAVKVSQELPRALSATIQLKIEYDRSARPAILPKVGLVILAFGSFGLDCDNRPLRHKRPTARSGCPGRKRHGSALLGSAP